MENQLGFQSTSAIAVRELDRIRDEIDAVRRRSRAEQFWKLMGVMGFVVLGIGLMLRGAADSGAIAWPMLVLAVIMILFVATIASVFISRSRSGGAAGAATRIESAFPDLAQRLVTAEGLSDDQARGPLARHLVRETHEHFRSHQWMRAVPAGSL
ncbi:MAG: hypothetical protein AAFU85_19885, partial [Planctomycetota bacterium]